MIIHRESINFIKKFFNKYIVVYLLFQRIYTALSAKTHKQA